MMGAEVELLDLNEELGFDLGAWCAAVAKAPRSPSCPTRPTPWGWHDGCGAVLRRCWRATPANTGAGGG